MLRKLTLMLLISLGALIVPISSAQQSSSADVTYSYDALGRLERACYTNGYYIGYEYDAAGNRSEVATEFDPVACGIDPGTTTPPTGTPSGVTLIPYGPYMIVISE